MYPSVIESLTNFLAARRETHNDATLLDQWCPDMETQVNVSAGDGWPVDGKRSTYTDGVNEWFNIRIPKKADSVPEFHDYKLRWPLDLYVDSIGCTGWDWRNRRSRWVGFDFDAITGHAAGVGVSDGELNEIRDAAQALPYVTTRRSTSGTGLHLYVPLDLDLEIENHTIHAALARAILGQMSTDTRFDFGQRIDCCGGNLWIWSRKMTSSNGGLSLLKPAERPLTENDLPANWRDNVPVITRKQNKIRVRGVDDKELDTFEALASSRQPIPLDDQHRAIIDGLISTRHTTIWVPDYHLLQTHTAAFAQVMEDQADTLGLVGVFKTISPGNNPGEPNCFAFPAPNGGWSVYLFGLGRQEAETWKQDGEGWTTCEFNQPPNLATVARMMGGVEDPEKGGYVFDTAEDAQKAASFLGERISIPKDLKDREAGLKVHKDGRLIFQIVREKDDDKQKGWVDKRGHWKRILKTKARIESDSDEINYDNIVRALVSPTGRDAGWVHLGSNGEWLHHPTDKIKYKLLFLGRTKPEAEIILGGLVNNTWKIVNLPFQPEYPGNRQWNLDAAQLKYEAAKLDDDEVPHHPHWDLVLNHCGSELDAYLPELQWARDAGIRTGRDYLLAWISSMFRHPLRPLPYLFLYSETQNNGKSTLHEAIALLMTKGVASADRALTNANDFNGELANAILAYIEEKDISSAGGSAYNKIKDWVTSPVIWIRKMRTNAYAQPNSLHFIHTSNSPDSLPLGPGDTRITMLLVPELVHEIPKALLMEKLQEQAPHFLRTIYDLELPPLTGRLGIPVVSTANKVAAEKVRESELVHFIDESCRYSAGAKVLFKEFFDRFLESLSPTERRQWSNKKKLINSLPERFPYGKSGGNKRYIGNISWVESPVPDPLTPLISIGGILRPNDNGNSHND